MNVWAKLFASRKGIAAFVAVLFGLVAATGLTVAAVLGKVSWAEYFSRIEVLSGITTTALVALILGVAHEDAAAKGNPMGPGDPSPTSPPIEGQQ